MRDIGPGTRQPRDPVGWMLGPDLVARLGRLREKRHDPRAWMTVPLGHRHDEHRHCDGRYAPTAPEAAPPEAEEIWFDYLSDMGDSGEAMYAIAYACQVDFDGTLGDAAVPTDGIPLTPVEASGSPSATPGARLPRGQFLFVGGDAGYHIGDEATIKARVQEPFDWARADLPERHDPPVRLYGIPANHDWYDHLKGFAKLFQRPTPDDPGIELKGFQRVQQASYAALQLPHGWQLWGLDIDGDLDPRQAEYFRSLLGSGDVPPPRLILCTPSPAIAFGRSAPGDVHQQALTALTLPHVHDDRAALPKEHCLLELSGDVHHYARYQAKDDTGYCSVVSGLGGAFHHPSFVRLGERAAAALYPSAAESLAAIAPKLFHPRSLLVGSWIRAIPFVLSVLLGLAATSSGGVGWLLDKVFPNAQSYPALPSLLALAASGGSGLGWLISQVFPPDSCWLQPTRAADLGRDVLLLIALGLFGIAILVANRLFREIVQVHEQNPQAKRNLAEASWGFGLGGKFNPYRSFWLTTLIVAGALIGLMAFLYSPFAPRASVAALDAFALLVGVGALLGGAYVGWSHAAPKGLSWTRKLAISLIGLVHAAVQVVTPLICARLVPASLSGDLVDISSFRSPVTAVVAVLLGWVLFVPGRQFFIRRWTSLLIATAVASWVTTVAALVTVAPHNYTVANGSGAAFFQFVVAPSIAAFLGTTYFTWYLAIVGSLDGHWNEVGGAARVVAFRQFIRFHLTKDGLRGHTIAVEQSGPAATPQGLSFRLIDVFTLQTPQRGGGLE